MWYDEIGENNDIILSSCVSVVRNIRGYKFPTKMDAEEKEFVLTSAEAFAKENDMKFVRLEELSDGQRVEFLRHKIANIEELQNPSGKGLVISDDESLSIVVNQGNHFRIQGNCNGGDINSIFWAVEKLAVNVEKKFDIAFSERLGFLSSNPFEVGTGLRVSFIISVPAIEKGGVMPKVLQRLNSLDWKMVPYIGDGNKRTGNLYEVYSTSTLGVTEKKIYERAITVLEDIVKVERMCREAIYNKNKIIVEDQYFRSYGMLKYCQKLELSEALEALGWLRLAHSMIKDNSVDLDLTKINKMTDRICTEMKHLKGNASIKVETARAKQIRAILEGESN
ncbi:MAG: hypothetical protein MJ166_07765 [Clostridia bacterium]|nr:hypothetical protein [Clostridia bacterium]